MHKPSLSERLVFLVGRLQGLAHTSRYPIDLGMQAELEEIAKELLRLSRHSNVDTTPSS